MEATLRVLNDLERSGILRRYAIGGAVAAIFYMEPFLTYDLDVFVILPETAGGLLTVEPVYAALRQQGYEADGECIVVEGMPVRFLPAYNALLEEALAAAHELTYAHTPVRVLRPEHLAAIMVQTGRDKDRQRFATFLREAPLDEERLAPLLNRHGLNEKYHQWKTSI